MAHRLLLLHGTFAPEAEWTKEGSVFRKQVGCHLGRYVTFDAFEWTGGNSSHDRDEASRTLLDKIRDCSKQNPSERLCLVAHSHGGNVALKALSTAPDVQTMVSGIVCISTPFIHVERRRELDLIIDLLKHSEAPWLFWLACLLLGLVPTLLGLGQVTRYGALVAAGVITVWLMLNGEPRHFIDTYKARASEHVSDFLVKAVWCPLLVLRVERDEALLWVAAFDRFSRAAGWLAATAFKTYFTAAVLAALATTSGGLTFLSVVAFVTGSESIWRLIWWIVSGGLLVIGLGVATIPLIAAISILSDFVLVSLASALRALPISWGEALFTAVWARVSARAEPAPWPGMRCRVKAYDIAAMKRRGLRHSSLYSFPATLADISTFVTFADRMPRDVQNADA